VCGDKQHRPCRTSGRLLRDGWAAALCLRARSCAAPFLCVWTPLRSALRVPVRASSSLAHRAPSRLHSVCASLVCHVSWCLSGSQRVKEGMTEVFPTGLGAGAWEGTRTCDSLEDPPSRHMLVSVQAPLRWRNCISSQRASVASYS
jgi:hypothetical protein